MEITKHYKLTKWCQYEEAALIGDVSGMSVEFIGDYTTASGHVCATKLWLDNSTGEGWEIRIYQVQE